MSRRASHRTAFTRLAIAALLFASVGATFPGRAAPGIVIAATWSPATDYTYFPGGDTTRVHLDPDRPPAPLVDQTAPGAPLVVPAGSSLTFINLGGTEHHSVWSYAKKPNGDLKFFTNMIEFGASADVQGVSALPAGTYKFFCGKHQWQQGTLVVQ